MFYIGEFSKMGKTTIKTLHHYDRIGLLHPEAVDGATGYRLYTTRQLAELHKGSAALSYKKDDLYDVVLEAVVMFCEKNPRPIARRKNPSIYR